MPEDDNAELAFDIAFALRQHRYKPPSRFDLDPDVRERYYRDLAARVVQQLRLGWDFTRKERKQ